MDSHSSQSADTYQQRAAAATDMTVRPIRGDYLNGYHFSPIDRRYAGTIVIHGGSEGSPDYDMAETLSRWGYEVLALHFWGQDNQQPTLAEVPLDQFTEVVEYIHAEIPQPTPITAAGRSKGAEYVTVLASHGYDVDNLVAWTPAEYSYPGLDFNSREEKPSFVHNGAAVPFASFREVSTGTFAASMWRMLVALPPRYRATYEEAAQANDGSAAIDLSSWNGNALFFAGDDDAMWQGDQAAAALAAQSPRFEAVIYPDAGHIFAADSDSMGTGWQEVLGGTAAGNAEAFRDHLTILGDRLARWHGPLGG